MVSCVSALILIRLFRVLTFDSCHHLHKTVLLDFRKMVEGDMQRTKHQHGPSIWWNHPPLTVFLGNPDQHPVFASLRLMWHGYKGDQSIEYFKMKNVKFLLVREEKNVAPRCASSSTCWSCRINKFMTETSIWLIHENTHLIKSHWNLCQKTTHPL